MSCVSLRVGSRSDSNVIIGYWCEGGERRLIPVIVGVLGGLWLEEDPSNAAVGIFNGYARSTKTILDSAFGVIQESKKMRNSR